MVMRTMSVLSCAAVVLLVHLLSPASAHVSLTFPPARSPNYDFLDNIRTGGPCGIPRECIQLTVTLLLLLHDFLHGETRVMFVES